MKTASRHSKFSVTLSPSAEVLCRLQIAVEYSVNTELSWMVESLYESCVILFKQMVHSDLLHFWSSL